MPRDNVWDREHNVYVGDGPVPRRVEPAGRDERPPSHEPIREPSENEYVDERIFDRALRISSPRFEEEERVPSSRFHKKVIRQVEVPYEREVKVPVRTRKIVPTMVRQRVATRRYIEVPTTKDVDEEYTAIEEVPATREREIWVKKIITEDYMKQVPVKRVRTIQVPTTELREVTDYEEVDVPAEKIVEEDAYRVDRVEDTKIVEVEEFEEYEMVPRRTGKSAVGSTRNLGPTVGQNHLARQRGGKIYDPQDERVSAMDEDPHPDSNGRASPRYGRTARPQSAATVRPMTPNGRRLGMLVKDTASRDGVEVHRLNYGEAAYQAGLQEGDIITRVRDVPIYNMADFRAIVSESRRALDVEVSRNGRIKRYTIRN